MNVYRKCNPGKLSKTSLKLDRSIAFEITFAVRNRRMGKEQKKGIRSRFSKGKRYE